MFHSKAYHCTVSDGDQRPNETPNITTVQSEKRHLKQTGTLKKERFDVEVADDNYKLDTWQAFI